MLKVKTFHTNEKIISKSLVLKFSNDLGSFDSHDLILITKVYIIKTRGLTLEKVECRSKGSRPDLFAGSKNDLLSSSKCCLISCRSSSPDLPRSLSPNFGRSRK